MNRKLYLFLFANLFVTCFLTAQMTVPPCPEPGDSQEEAPLLECCLDGYTYHTDFAGGTGVPPGFCAPVDNGQWLAFKAEYEGITLGISVLNCLQNDIWGLEFQIFGIYNDCGVNHLYPVSACLNQGTNGIGVLVAQNFIPGHVYYLFIDGWQGNVCEYNIKILDTQDPVPPPTYSVSGPTSVLANSSATYTLSIDDHMDHHNPCQNFVQDDVQCACEVIWSQLDWTGPPGATITPIPGTFSAIVQFGNQNGSVCVSYQTNCFTISACTFVMIECADAGNDDSVCGYKYQLQGWPQTGSWKFICDESDGAVIFSDDSHEPTITVSECGDYVFEFISPGVGINCPGTDRVTISFEDPSWSETNIVLDMEINFENVDCEDGGEAPPCTNLVEIPSANPPNVSWEFCTYAFCQSLIYSDSITGIDTCEPENIFHTVENPSDFTNGSCEDFNEDQVLDYFFDIVDAQALDAFGDLSCPLVTACFEKELVDSVLETITVLLPNFQGLVRTYSYDGVFHELLNQNFFSYNNLNFMFLVEPSADYFGGGPISYKLYEINNFGDTVYSSIAVDIDIKTDAEWTFDTLTKERMKYIYEDPFGCPGNTIIGPTITIPPPPAYPCDANTISFPPFDCEECGINVNAFASSDLYEINCCDPCVELTGSGSSNEGNYSVNWDSGGSTSIACGGGNYNLLVTSLPSGCTAEADIYIYENFEIPGIYIVPPIPIDCKNDCVQLETSISGSPWNVVTNWEGPNGYFSIELSPTVCLPGVYTVTATNVENCCVSTYSVEVVEDFTPDYETVEATICEGDCYILNGEPFCTEGDFVQTWIDGDGCEIITDLSIKTNPVESFDLSITLCEGSLFPLNGTIYDQNNSSGTEVLTGYLGCDSLVNVQLEFLPKTNQFITVSKCEGDCYELNGEQYCSPGVYSQVTVGANGCEEVIELTIDNYPPNTSTFNPTICQEGEIQINGTVYNYSNPFGTEIMVDSKGCDSLVNIYLSFFEKQTSIIQEAICPGDCIIINGEEFCDEGVFQQNTIDANGCLADVTLIVDKLPLPEGTIIQTLCPGESIILNGNVYDASNPQGEETISNPNGCDSLISIFLDFYIEEYEFLEVTICEGECYELNGQSYCVPGIYTQNQIDVNGCQSTTDLFLEFYPVQSSNFIAELCEGESISINGTVYDVNSPTGTEVFTDQKGCDSLVNVNLSFIPIEYVYLNAEICAGDCYDWIGGQVCDPGVYTTISIGNNGCDVVSELFLDQLPSQNSLYSDILCEGEFLVVNGNIYDENQPTGVEVFTDQNGCDSTMTIDLQYVDLEVQILPTEVITCYAPQVMIFSEIDCSEDIESLLWTNPNGNILSSPNELEIEVNSAGDYILEVQSISGCLKVNQITVSEDIIAPIALIGGDEYLDCENGEAVLHCENTNVYYEWSGPGIDSNNQNDQSPKVNLPGIYELIITNPINGCTSTNVIEVVEYESLSFEVGLTESCANQSNGAIAVLNPEGGKGPYEFSLAGFPNLNSPFNNLSPGIYIIQLEDALGCLEERSVEIIEIPALEVFEAESFTICEPEVVLLEPLTNFQNDMLTFKWDDGSTTPARSISEPGVYNVEITSDCDEIVDLSFEVKSNRFALANKIYVPNAFSPNDDHVNDFFMAYSDIELSGFQLQIFDRWGNQLFQSENQQEGWNGKMSGRTLPTGVYIWKLWATGLSCDDTLQDIVLQGDLVLVK